MEKNHTTSSHHSYAEGSQEVKSTDAYSWSMNGCKIFFLFFSRKINKYNPVVGAKWAEKDICIGTYCIHLFIFDGLQYVWQMYCMLLLVIMIILWASSQGGCTCKPYLKSTSSLQTNPSWYRYSTMYLNKIEFSEQWYPYFPTFFGWMCDIETSCFPLLSTLSVSSAPMVSPNPRAIPNWINVL